MAAVVTYYDNETEYTSRIETERAVYTEKDPSFPNEVPLFMGRSGRNSGLKLPGSNDGHKNVFGFPAPIGARGHAPKVEKLGFSGVFRPWYPNAS